MSTRLARGDKGINPLDEACRLHDIRYSQTSDSARRAQADRELAERAWKRVVSSDAGLGERAAALAVTNIMKVKSKLGGGGRVKRKRTTQRRRRRGAKKTTRATYLQPYQGQGLYLRPYRGGGCSTSRKKKRTKSKRRR